MYLHHLKVEQTGLEINLACQMMISPERHSIAGLVEITVIHDPKVYLSKCLEPRGSTPSPRLGGIFTDVRDVGSI